MERDEAARSLCLCTSTAVVNVWRVQTYTKTARAAVSCNGEIIQKSVEKTTTKRRGEKKDTEGLSCSRRLDRGDNVMFAMAAKCVFIIDVCDDGNIIKVHVYCEYSEIAEMTVKF